MKTLESNKTDESEARFGYFRRQFDEESTYKQRGFDWVFGVILPVICFSFDPAVFNTSEIWGSEAYLAEIKPFAYLLSFASIMAMMAWLIWGKKLKWLSGALSGFFAVGGIVSLGVGVTLLPISILGLLAYFLGALGFVPFLSAIVFLRNAVRTHKSAKNFIEKPMFIRAFVLTGLFAVITPAVINVEINRMVDRLRTGETSQIIRSANLIYLVSPIVNVDSLTRDYHDSKDPERKEALEEAYRTITGKEMGKRLRKGSF